MYHFSYKLEHIYFGAFGSFMCGVLEGKDGLNR